LNLYPYFSAIAVTSASVISMPLEAHHLSLVTHQREHNCTYSAGVTERSDILQTFEGSCQYELYRCKLKYWYVKPMETEYSLGTKEISPRK
jgi:hypothetical protein